MKPEQDALLTEVDYDACLNCLKEFAEGEHFHVLELGSGELFALCGPCTEGIVAEQVARGHPAPARCEHLDH